MNRSSEISSTLAWADDLDRWELEQPGRERREDLFSRIVAAKYVGVTDLVPYLTVIPDLGKPLALRCDVRFNVTQALYGILRSGSHGFALVNAYGADNTKRASCFITQLNEEPYGKPTKLVAPLEPEVSISLGGNSKLVPEVTAEGQEFMISTDVKGEVRIKADRIGRLPFQLITAISPLSHREESDNMPLDEVGTWSLPPGFLRRVLKLK